MLKKTGTKTGREFGFTGQWADKLFTLTKCDKCDAEFPVPNWYEDMECFECEVVEDPEDVERSTEALKAIIKEGQRTGKIKGKVWA